MIAQNHPTKYWHQLDNGRVQCDLCPNGCKLQEGQRGICFVRMRENNQIVLTTYGRVSGFGVDPIEKKPLYHFLPGSLVYSFGTIGCNLACQFCQNSNISKSAQKDLSGQFIDPKDIAKVAKEYRCQSVAFTYNEPTIFMEYAIDVAKECRKLGLKTVAVTNGYICDKPREEFFSYIDAANVDLKSFTEEFYRDIAHAHLQPVLDTLLYLKKYTKVWVEVTTLLIPGENDSEPEITQLTEWIRDNLGSDVPLHFSAFYPSWKMLDRLPTPLEALVRARNIALKGGLHYVYTGNLHYPEGNKTFCHNCKKCIIARDSYSIVKYNMNIGGNCLFCNAQCEGLFE